jgi:hypothetical protein
MTATQTTASTLRVNERVHTLGKLKRTSSEAKFTKALETLVADWQAESLADEGGNPKYANFKDTKVWAKAASAGKVWGECLTLTFDGCGYDLLSCQNEYHIESYREALTALCTRHGWTYEDYSSWAISFYRD